MIARLIGQGVQGPVSPAIGANRRTLSSDFPLHPSGLDGQVDIYIGGLGDKRLSRVVAQYVKDLKARNPSRNIGYFSHDKGIDAAEFVARYARKNAITNIVGHSYGADTAAQVARNLSGPVNLIGVDPVSKFGSRVVDRTPNIKSVITVLALPIVSNSIRGDFWAQAGRATGTGWKTVTIHGKSIRLPSIFANPDNLISAPTNHNRFNVMMETLALVQSSKRSAKKARIRA